VQRLATIAHGDGICTTHIPGPLARTVAHPVAGHTRAGNRSTPASPVPRERGAPPGPPEPRTAQPRTTSEPPRTSEPRRTSVTHRERTPA
jgi:hypothetical protein